MSCPNCGMYVHWGPLYYDLEALIKDSPEKYYGPTYHKCPEPYDYETAVALRNSIIQVGMIVHPRTKAAIEMGLKAGPKDD